MSEAAEAAEDEEHGEDEEDAELSDKDNASPSSKAPHTEIPESQFTPNRSMLPLMLQMFV